MALTHSAFEDSLPFTKRNLTANVFTDCNVVEDSSILGDGIADVQEQRVYNHSFAKNPVMIPPLKPPDMVFSLLPTCVLPHPELVATPYKAKEEGHVMT